MYLSDIYCQVGVDMLPISPFTPEPLKSVDNWWACMDGLTVPSCTGARPMPSGVTIAQGRIVLLMAFVSGVLVVLRRLDDEHLPVWLPLKPRQITRRGSFNNERLQDPVQWTWELQNPKAASWKMMVWWVMACRACHDFRWQAAVEYTWT